MNRIVALSLALLAAVCAVQGSSRFPPPLPFETLIERPNNRFRVAAANEPSYRLPNNTVPLEYSVTLTTNVHQNDFDFSGTVEILIKAVEDTKAVVLHARSLIITGAKLFDKNAEGAFVNEHNLTVSYNELVEFLTLTPEDDNVGLKKNEEYKLVITYKGRLRVDNGGFYRSSYKKANNETGWLATTQFESTDARHGFPCYDEPALKAKVTITINHGANFFAISNMPVDEAKSKSGTTVFQQSPLMSTYLVAFIVSEFKSTSASHEDFKHKVFSRPGTEHEQDFSLLSSVQILNRLAEYYGIEFSLPKMDQVAVPDFAAGAMENWGLVTYREEYLLYNEKTSTINTKHNVASTIAHEYTHQWFGNLVAVKWWSYLWLKEGFATLFAYIGTDLVYPKWDVMQMMITSEWQRALNNDGSRYARPMTHYVEDPDAISQLYDAVSYSKAGCVLWMWQHALGEEVFRSGLNRYLTERSYSAGEENDLFDALQVAAKEHNVALPSTVREMFSSWSRQGGAPVLTVERNYEDNTFTITQEAFFNDPEYRDNRTWYVPFNYVSEADPDFRDTSPDDYLLKERQVTVNPAKGKKPVDKDGWLLLNKKSTSYYRVNYDEKNWKLITQGLKNKTHKIHVHNRAALLFDAYRFSVTKRLPQSTLLELTTYLSNEEEFAPWSTVYAFLMQYDVYLRGDNQYSLFQFYVNSLIANTYDKLGVNEDANEAHLKKFTRFIIINLACTFGNEHCLADTNKKLQELVEEGKEVEPNLQAVVYCSGLRQSADKEFDFIFKRLLNEQDQAQRQLLINNLGCSQSKEQLSRFVSTSIDETVPLRVQERTTILMPVYSRGEVGLLTCIDFLTNNFGVYADLTPSFGDTNPLDNDIRGMAIFVVNNELESKLLALVDLVKSHPKVTPTLEEDVKATINANFAWLDKNRDPIVNWLTVTYRSSASSVMASYACVLTTGLLVVSRLLA